MAMDEILDSPVVTTTEKKKIYTSNAIRAATFCCGPLVGGYFIAENFKAFNDNDKSNWTWVFTITGTMLILWLSSLIPINAHPGPIFAIINASIVVYLVKHFQGASIDAHINSGGEAYTGWRVLGISLIGLIITLIITVIVYLLSNLKGH
jgi:hypothetical protein